MSSFAYFHSIENQINISVSKWDMTSYAFSSKMGNCLRRRFAAHPINQMGIIACLYMLFVYAHILYWSPSFYCWKSKHELLTNDPLQTFHEIRLMKYSGIMKTMYCGPIMSPAYSSNHPTQMRYECLPNGPNSSFVEIIFAFYFFLYSRSNPFSSIDQNYEKTAHLLSIPSHLPYGSYKT